ncbi:MAG TPA: HPr family phosphocarrier protein [Bacillota bacterium]|nr:HPr family phosphocarrier protein [Bacillota bacterium]HPF42653.1 HPr family phosphocarrier protein [Bacillota bacterium]HPJ85524.1 HPr family phosphocarrier protein [Bacillota bacterium]HPQ62086.1 HPr family phosphocarrier protein [Bacillota bacterium]HRX92460.1 HPr family phosphocarrier protein [Candidatus Izemoplasmatales bacterium]
MIENKYKITYPYGLHARTGTMLVAKANGFKSEMVIEFDDRKVNLKSIMGVLSLAVPANRSFRIMITGSDEEEASQAIARAIADINEMK